MPRQFQYYDKQSLSALTYDFIENAIKANSGEIAFYRTLAERQGGPVLDVAAGTGRVTWLLAEAGYSVVGLDLSPAMLEQAEAKRARYPAEVGARVRLAQQDMTAFDLGERFPLVIVAYRGFNHLLTSEQQRAALQCLKRHMLPNGCLVLHMIEPSADLVAGHGSTGADTGGMQITQSRTGETLHYRVLERRADPARQIIVNVIQYRVVRPNGGVVVETEETLTYRWGTQQELRYLFELSGLAVETLHGDFQGGAPRPGKEQIWVLRHADPATAKPDHTR